MFVLPLDLPVRLALDPGSVTQVALALRAHDDVAGVVVAADLRPAERVEPSAAPVLVDGRVVVEHVAVDLAVRRGAPTEPEAPFRHLLFHDP